jgi:hypothetical protein
MSRHAMRDCLFVGLIGGAFAVAGATALVASAHAQAQAELPDFSAEGWVNEGTFNGGGLVQIPGQPYFRQDPRFPHVPNNVGRQPTYWIADLASTPTSSNGRRT